MNENENYQNTNTHSNYQQNTDNTDKWIKFFILTLAVIFGTFLAVYFVSDQAIKHATYSPFVNHHKMMNKFMEKNMRTMNDFERAAMIGSPIMPVETLSFAPITKLQEGDNGYKLIINLKHFNNDINKIKLDIKPDKVSILASNDNEKKDSIYSLSFSQTYILDEKIDTKKVTKEVIGENAVVYLPFDDND